MRRLLTLAGLLALATGCGLFGGTAIEPDCTTRTVWYADTDGDGDRVYIGCEGPEGWTANPPRPDDSADTEPDSEVDSDSDGDTEVETEVETEVDSDTHTDSDPETDTPADTEAAP